MFRTAKPSPLGSADPPLLQSVMVGQATQRVQTGAFDVRALPVGCAQTNAQARAVSDCNGIDDVVVVGSSRGLCLSDHLPRYRQERVAACAGLALARSALGQ